MTKRMRMSVRMPYELHTALKQIAREEGYTLNALVLQILWDWIKAQDEKARAKEEWTKPHS